MIILSTFQGFERAYPLIIIFSLLMGYFITHDPSYLLLASALELSSIMNQGLKDFVFKKIMGTNEFPLIGKGTRPEGATDCGEFIDIDNRKSSSYGMPSGHSSFSAFFGIVMIMMILDGKYSNNIKIIKVIIVLIISGIIIFSRVNLGCHTFQQVLVGGMIGSSLGYLYYSNLGKIKSLFKIK